MGPKSTAAQILESHRRPPPYPPPEGEGNCPYPPAEGEGNCPHPPAEARGIARGAGAGLGPDAAQGDPLRAGVVGDRHRSGSGAGDLWKEGHAYAAAHPRCEGPATVRRHGVVVACHRDTADGKRPVTGIEEEDVLRSRWAPDGC